MKPILRALAFLLTLLLLISPVLYAQDKTVQNDDDFAVFLLLFAIVAISAMAGAMIVCAVVAALLLGFVVVLVLLGILSASLAIGMHQRSFQAGFKTFVLIFSTLGGLVAGGSGALLFAYLFVDLSTKVTLLTGTACGAAGGFLFGFIFIKVIRWVALQLKRKVATL
jgi:hypothetical protein